MTMDSNTAAELESQIRRTTDEWGLDDAAVAALQRLLAQAEVRGGLHELQRLNKVIDDRQLTTVIAVDRITDRIAELTAQSAANKEEK